MLVVAIASLVAVGCRCGGNTTSEPAQPSNEQTGIAYGLDWLPSDTTIVARFAPGYGPLADYLETHPAPPDCVARLLPQIAATYMVHRYIADPPVTVIEEDFDRDEVERCVVTALGVELRRDDDDPRLTSVVGGDHESWIGWSDRRVVWHEDLERVLDLLYAADRISPESLMASLLARVSQTGIGVVGTADLTSPFFGTPCVGFIDRWQYGGSGDFAGRLLFADESAAEAVIAAKAKRVAQKPGYVGQAALRMWEFRQEGNEIALGLGLANHHPSDLVRFAEHFFVPTGAALPRSKP